jgi:hypothetical protein
LGIDQHGECRPIGFLAQVPAGGPGKLAAAGDRAGLGHAAEAEVGRLGQHAGEHDAGVIGGQISLLMGEQVRKPGPAMHLGEKAGDAGIGDHGVEPLGEVLGRLGCDRLERADLHLIALDPNVLKRVGGDLGRHLRKAPVQQGAALGQIVARGRGCGDGQRPGRAHGGEQRIPPGAAAFQCLGAEGRLALCSVMVGSVHERDNGQKFADQAAAYEPPRVFRQL